ncbi:MAG TPA: delta-60 repeat domain-containing protein [Usitatibacter sp.]|nr:delta-60 repeat domain-containing protein [Usitatibacter sp.]
MRTILACLAVTVLGFAQPARSQSPEDCKNHYILRGCEPCPQAIPIGPPVAQLQYEGKTLALGVETRILDRPWPRSSLAIVSVKTSAMGARVVDLDAYWGECGVARIPIWGADDAARAMAWQPDGKVLVFGTAPDPTEYGVPDWSLEPHHYLAVIRLNNDGTLDETFGDRGRRVFRVGEAEHGVEYDVNSLARRLQVLDDGRILVSHTRDNPIAVAMIRSDGSVEWVAPSTPRQSAVAMGWGVEIEFTNGRGDFLLVSDPDQAVALDLGREWYRTGRATGEPVVLWSASPR